MDVLADSCQPRASLANNKGSANILKIADLIDISTIIQGLNMATSPDATIRAIAKTQLDAEDKGRIKRRQVSYLNGSLKNEFGRDGGDIASL